MYRIGKESKVSDQPGSMEREKIVEAFALKMLLSGKIYIDKEELGYLTELNKYKELINNGILIEQQSQISFFHQSFLEWVAAKHIALLPSAEMKLILNDILYDKFDNFRI
ncbi:MAG: hypothetical protein KKA19_02340, partial [Candidatus Margulisbacteria bacterium]|nr:hypothetical protein [Candidatus Margulisiibacteriota bacterium]